MRTRPSLAIVLLTIAACGMACGQPPSGSRASERPRLRFATGDRAGVFYVIGSSLAAAYNRQHIDTTVLARPAGSIEESVDDLDHGNVDLAFADSESVYVAHRGGSEDFPDPHKNIRAVAVLFPTVVQVFTAEHAGVSPVANLKGKRIGVGQRGGYADHYFQIVLDAYGLGYDQVTPAFGPVSAELLRTGQLDGAVFFTPIWHSSIADVVSKANLTLISLDRTRIAQIQAASERNHFLKSTTVPRGTYPGQERDVLTLGEDILLVCRADLPETLVYNLTRILFESTAELARAHPAGRAIDVERGATAAIPLHTGALRYYRERDLPR